MLPRRQRSERRIGMRDVLGAVNDLRTSRIAHAADVRRPPATPGTRFASIVVRLVPEDLVAAVDLLQQHDASQLVRKGHGAERQTMVDLVELEPERAADDEADVAPALAAILQEASELLGVVMRAGGVQQGDERPLRDAPRDLLVLADLHELHPRMTGEQLLVVLHVVGEWWAQTADGQDDDAHGCDTSPMDEDDRERHINIHFSPEIMAGVYANFANVSHSEYEFTITFARVDHEVDDDEIPGVVVSRVNLSPRFMRELIDAMEDNYSKWQTSEGIKNLPEFGGPDEPGRQ